MSNSKIKIWIEAARPQTLPAAFVPVVVGASLAYQHQAFNLAITLITLLCAALIQVGTNFANDYYDFQKGADREDRIGFQRATATGLISSRQMKIATFSTMALALGAGLILVWHAGWAILVIGLASLLFGVLYTGGPFPLAYNGLGDIFVFIFFGTIATMGTYFVNTLSWSQNSFWFSLPVGALTTNILVINNLRDIHQDAASNKNTLGVIFGEQFLKYEYLCMLVIAYVTPFYLWFQTDFSAIILLPLLTIPFAGKLFYTVINHKEKSTLNSTLKQTAMLLTFYGAILSGAILFSA